MTEEGAVSDALWDSLADIGPPTFRSHLEGVLEDQSLTPGVLTVKTARALDGSTDLEASAMRGAGVQLSYEGLRLTRAVVDERGALDTAVEEAQEEYYLDLLAAEVLVSRGFYHLATTGVSDQAVEIVRRFGRNQTHELDGQSPTEASLEEDVIKLAVNAGADMSTTPVSSAVTSFGERLATELEREPLPDPDDALAGIEGRITTAATASGVEADRH